MHQVLLGLINIQNAYSEPQILLDNHQVWILEEIGLITDQPIIFTLHLVIATNTRQGNQARKAKEQMQ